MWTETPHLETSPERVGKAKIESWSEISKSDDIFSAVLKEEPSMSVPGLVLVLQSKEGQAIKPILVDGRLC